MNLYVIIVSLHRAVKWRDASTRLPESSTPARYRLLYRPCSIRKSSIAAAVSASLQDGDRMVKESGPEASCHRAGPWQGGQLSYVGSLRLRRERSVNIR